MLSAILFLRRWLGLAAVPVMVVALLLGPLLAVVYGVGAAQARPAFVSITFLIVSSLLAGGAIAGFGVILSVSIAERRILTPGGVIGAILVGAVFALAFEPAAAEGLKHEAMAYTAADPEKPWLFQYGLTAWEATMGTYLLAISRRAR
jgi:hypothetical protein